MKLTQDKPKFLPMKLTFETQEEWDTFHQIIIAAEVSNNYDNYDVLNTMLFRIHEMIIDGLKTN